MRLFTTRSSYPFYRWLGTPSSRPGLMEDRVTPSESSQPAPNNLPPAAPQTSPTTLLLLKHPAAPQAPRRSPNFAHHPAAPQAPRCSSSTPLLLKHPAAPQAPRCSPS
ncbi:hypothetical protein FN846DRAFT_896184 [Sphaerosporella brunnea]|uniref:Uncharacterized protein n=1 Tax=Sphaerosporella brunnea TaxID=1250544 RepID=A0A5J5ED95_9PEZI|nr:hypothetical protein FN846DRAFT_896184 [Sphaerosporella brunnea]